MQKQTFRDENFEAGLFLGLFYLGAFCVCVLTVLGSGLLSRCCHRVPLFCKAMHTHSFLLGLLSLRAFCVFIV